MTAPRQVLPGTTYLVTRRCSQREFLLKPSKFTNAVFTFVLAVAAERYGILLHAWCVMSNHYHLVLTDPTGQLPRFSQLLDALVARVLNASYGRWESFWAPSTYSAVALTSADDIIEKIAYTLANPVAAGLVPHGHEWPGVWSDPAAFGGPALLVERPDFFFSKDGTLPERLELRLAVPTGFESAESFRDRVRARVAVLEQEAATQLASEGRSFLGKRRVLKQKRTDRPASREPRRRMTPHVAGRDKWKRMEAIGRLVSFLEDYKKARLRLWDGETGVVFPAGTFLLRVTLGVACAAA